MPVRYENTSGAVVGIGGTIAAHQVAFGTGADTIGGDPAFTWDNVNKTLNITQPNISGITLTIFSLTGGTLTNCPASVEVTDINFNLNRTIQHATGDYSNQRSIFIDPPTYSYIGASTIDLGATIHINGAVIEGANATINNNVGVIIGNIGGSNTYKSQNVFNLAVGCNGIANGIGNVSERSALIIPPLGTINLGDQTASLGNFACIDIKQQQLSSSVNTRTISNASALLIDGPPINLANVVFTNGPYSIFVDSGDSRFDGKILESFAQVASANDMTVNTNIVYVTAATQINRISPPLTLGTCSTTLVLIFASNPVVKNNQASGGGFYSIKLDGGSDFATVAGSTLTLIWDVTNSVYREIGRAST